jgi:hypothetical protein
MSMDWYMSGSVNNMKMCVNGWLVDWALDRRGFFTALNMTRKMTGKNLSHSLNMNVENYMSKHSYSIAGARKLETAAAPSCVASSFDTNSVKLMSLDLFAGCGGLTRGLEDSGVVKCKWAVELDLAAARTFKKNFPQAVVFKSDLRNWFKKVQVP